MKCFAFSKNVITFAKNIAIMEQNENIKELPKGVSKFREVREGNLYYVDKTSFLSTIEKAGRFLLMTRPRRFGKSLFVSMMKDYYDINRKDLFQEEFKGLSVAKNPTRLQGYFQVLHFDFSQVADAEGDTLEEKFSNYCVGELDDFIDYYENLYDDFALRKLRAARGHSAKIRQIRKQADRLGLHVYLIIDEYDNFTNAILSERGETAYRSLTHADGFYRTAFLTYKPNFERIFMIGVSPITMSDLTSNFNIPTNVSHYNVLNDVVGFSEKDVREMIDYYRDNGMIESDTDEILNKIRPWYDGYCFSKKKLEDESARMYNSNMVLFYLSELLTTGQAPENMVDPNTAMDFKKLQNIIDIDRRGAEIGESILEDISVNGYTNLDLKDDIMALQLVDTENLPSLMYYYGMLTWGKDSDGRNALVIPNLNARKQFYDSMAVMMSQRMELDTSKTSSLMQSAGEAGEWLPLMEYMAERFYSHSNVRIEGEKNIQTYLLGALNNSNCFLTYPELELNGYYCDLFMIPRIREDGFLRHCCIIELKYVKSDATDAEVQKITEEAKAQVLKYASTPKAQEFAQGTQIHPIVMVFKATKLEKLEDLLLS